MTEPAEDAGRAARSGQLQDRAVTGAAWTLLHTVIAIPIAFLVNLLLARTLAPEGYGRLAFLTTLIGIAGNVVALGLTSAMVQFGAKAHARGDEAQVRRVLSSGQGFRLLLVAPVLTVLVVWLVDVPVTVLVLAVVFGVWLPAAFDGAPIALFIENKTAAGAKIAMVSNLVVQAGVVATVVWVGTADSVWAVRVVLTAGGIALALVAISPAYRRAVLRPTMPTGFPSGFWKFALPTGAASLIAELALSRTEVVYLTWLSTPSAVGLYALAFGVAAHIFAPAHALTGPLLPAVSGLREVDPDRVGEAFARALRATATIVALLTTAALPALTVLVPVLYGDEFADAAPAVLILGVVGGFTVLTGPVSTFALARLSARTMLMASMAALVVNLGLALTLIPTVGLWGAVVANAGSSLTQFGVLVGSERRDLSLPIRQVATILVPVLTGCFATVAGWGLVGALGLAGIIGAAVASSGALVLLVAAFRLTGSGLESGDAAAIMRVAPPALRRPVEFALGMVTARSTSG